MIPKVLYRFFSKEQHTDDFVNGRIRLSTLNACRTLENINGRDENEGSYSLGIYGAHIHNKNPEIDVLRTNMHSIFDFGDNPNLQISNIHLLSTIDNAHVLCFSTVPSEYIVKNFGKFCVIINNPMRLFNLIIDFQRKNDRFFISPKFGHIRYDNQKGSIYDSNAWSRLGFSKSKKRFVNEREYRLLLLNHIYVQPDFIDIGDLSGIVSRRIF